MSINYALSVQLSKVQISASTLEGRFDDIDLNDDGKLDQKEMAVEARRLITEKAEKIKEAKDARKDLGALFASSMGPMGAMFSLLGDDFLKDTKKSKDLMGAANALDSEIAFFVKMSTGAASNGSLMQNGGIQYDDIEKLAKNHVVAGDSRSAELITLDDLKTGSAPATGGLVLNAFDTNAPATFDAGDALSEAIRTASGQTTTKDSGGGLDIMSILKPMLGPMGAILDLLNDDEEEDVVINIDEKDPQPDMMEKLLPLMLGGGAAAGGAGAAAGGQNLGFLGGGSGLTAGLFPSGGGAPAGGGGDMMSMLPLLMLMMNGDDE